MSIGLVVRFRRVARVAYSRHPAARLLRLGRYFTTGPTGRREYDIADILLLPLTGLAMTLWLLGTVPGASDAISMACSTACMP
jgi:hypothetical protein